MYNDVVELVTQTDSGTKDEYGDTVYSEQKKEVFCEIKSIGRTEFYQAKTAGEKPEMIIELADRCDYDGELFIDFEQIRYKVLKTYRLQDSDGLEITLYGGVRNECS